MAEHNKGSAADAMPEVLSPQLATLVSEPPDGPGWAYEIKIDGYRILARCELGGTRLFTRNGNDWTDRMESLAVEVGGLPVQSAWFDGEAVVLGDNGLPNFNALQNAFDRVGTEHIVYFVFDLLYLNGRDLRQRKFRERRRALETVFADHAEGRVRLSQIFDADGRSVLQSACKLGLEGVIAKRLNAGYVSSRTETWLKVKCARRQEFVIGGFTTRAGMGQEIGSLLLGVYDEKRQLRSAGSVGTGWDSKTAVALLRRLEKIEVRVSPFDPNYAPTKGRWSKRANGSERWVKPTQVAEVSFTEWTPDGSVRHPAFQGMRDDKPARTIRRDVASTLALSAPAAPPMVKISNKDRIIDASKGLRKGDLVSYYEAIAERMLPHLRDRPTSLVRGPTGVAGELFFQKHSGTLSIPGLRILDPGLWPGHEALIEIPTARGLVGAAQMNVIEFHTWNSRARKINEPDRMIFDLDPGEGVSWAFVQEAATLTRVMLTELGLDSWLKTSGGKGLHVVAPLSPRESYDTVNDVSRAIVAHLAKTIPSRFVAKSGAKNRIGKIFVDYHRNGHGATTAAAFSARARPGSASQYQSIGATFRLLAAALSGRSSQRQRSLRHRRSIRGGSIGGRGNRWSLP